jgi:hypothetical protein
MRPKNSKDKQKRKVKKFLSRKDEAGVLEDYNSGLSLKDLSQKYNMSKSALSNILKRYNVKCKLNHSHIKDWETIDLENIINFENNVSGVYSIYFVNKTDNNDIKCYIGSSVDIKTRIRAHISLLQSGSHYSSELSNHFVNNDYIMRASVLKRCSEENILQEERFYQHQYNRSCLLNSWLSTNSEDLDDWLKKAVGLRSYTNYKVMDNGCWESNYINKSGYASIKVSLSNDWGPGITKYFYTHRVAYWEKYGEYPELVRHKCGNSRCRNPDHLIKGNHRDNAIDKRGDFPEIFEKKWLEFNGDILKLSEHFSDKWSSNQLWQGHRVSYSVYEWERKLDLRKKYPEVLDSNNSRRFSLAYQKRKRNRSKKGLPR